MEKIGQQFERLLELLVEDLHVKRRRFACGERIHFAAKSIDFARDFGRGARARAFKEHVLDEMGVAGLGELLVPGPGVDPNARSYRLERRNPLGHHPHAIVQHELAVQDTYPEV